MKSKYIFLWGQKQSAMITEVMVNAIFDKKGKTNKGISEDMAVYMDGVVENYMPLKAIIEWRQNSKKYFNKKFSEKLFEEIDSFIEEFFVYCKSLNNINFNDLSNKELLKIIKKAEYFITKGLLFFATSSPGSTFLVEDKIKEILAKHVNNKDIEEEYFITLSTPSELDETMKERIDFFKILQKKEVSDIDLKNYARKYPALFMNTYDEREVMSFLKEKIQKEKGKNIVEEKNKIENIVKNTLAKHKKIYSKVSDEKLKYLASILQRAALDRYRLKNVWSGEEYMFLDALKELNKRINIDFSDMIKTYMFSDVYNFLNKGIVLSRQEVEDRKKCMILRHFSFNKNVFYTGDRALNYKLEKIGKENFSDISKSIKGQVANKGTVQGIAHLIFVRDIKQFSKDSESFKKGEILVTTMTSPVMIPIIKKTSAIVTDEGGICSHAAISAREFNIPCIVGTTRGSSIIKTGDLVEVDANKGVVKILKRK